MNWECCIPSTQSNRAGHPTVEEVDKERQSQIESTIMRTQHQLYVVHRTLNILDDVRSAGYICAIQ